MDNTTLDVNGFSVKVGWNENHLHVTLTKKRVREAGTGRLTRKARRVELTMADVCKAFSRHFELINRNGMTCLKFFKNDGIRHRPGPGKRIRFRRRDRSPRKFILTICGHEILVTVLKMPARSLFITLPGEGIGDDFTLHDLCIAIPKMFGLDRRCIRTHMHKL